MPPEAHPPSIGDVARLAGVSPQTVSRVANESDAVRRATRERVLAAMAELGYTPNHAARALRRGSFRSIGVIAQRLSRTGDARITEAVVAAAREQGYTITLVDLDTSAGITDAAAEISAAAVRLAHQAIDALVIIRADEAGPADLALPPGLPVVANDSRFVGHLPSVGVDQALGARLAVEHLLGLGHRTVHLLRGPLDSDPARQRAEAWQATLLAAGAEPGEVLVGDWTMASGYRLGLELLPQRPTAIFASNDEMAGGLLRAAGELGVRVPQDVSLVGFDDIPMAEYLWPPLTTIRQDFDALGRGLVADLLAQLRGEDTPEPAHRLIPCTLVERASTAPPGAP